MKRIIVFLALAALLLTPSLAMAQQTGIYVAPKFVYAPTYMKDVVYWEDGTPDTSFGNLWDNTFGGSLAFGFDFYNNYNIPVRAELEYAIFTKAEAGSDEVRQWNWAQTLFLNAYYDIHTGTKFIPYVGAGIGLGLTRNQGDANWSFGDENTGTKTMTNFAWNLGLGLGYQITNNVALDIGYRFADLGKSNTKVCVSAGNDWYFNTKRLYQHQFSLGLRFTF